MVSRILVLVVVAGAACSRLDSPSHDTASATPASTGPVVDVTLSALAAGDVAPTIHVPHATSVVRFRLPRVQHDTAELTAEVATAAGDRVRRWPVDEVRSESGAPLHVVTVPPYDLPPGAYTLTLWAGDADEVGRYPFAVAP